MNEYCKIQTIFKRDMSNKGKIIESEFTCPEFEYLKNNTWIFTEKVDGTNIRIKWVKEAGIRIGGRTDNAQIPTFLYDKIMQILGPKKIWNSIEKTDHLVLYGEGYGAKIQSGGKYKSDGVDFVLFDVNADGWWLQRKDVEDVAEKLQINRVPIIGKGTLSDAIEMTRTGFNSQWGNFVAEGIVLRPEIELHNRNNHRIITKIKHKDFR